VRFIGTGEKCPQVSLSLKTVLEGAKKPRNLLWENVSGNCLIDDAELTEGKFVQLGSESALSATTKSEL
jgi:hypothetical protein